MFEISVLRRVNTAIISDLQGPSGLRLPQKPSLLSECVCSCVQAPMCVTTLSRCDISCVSLPAGGREEKQMWEVTGI